MTPIAIDESYLTNGQVRKLDALRNSVRDALPEAAQWLARRQKASAARRAEPVAERIAQALADYEIRRFPAQDPHRL